MRCFKVKKAIMCKAT